MRLSELKTKESGIIKRINGGGTFRKRISEMGFIRGQKVKVIKNAPLKDPVEYSIMGYAISLRRAEAALIEVEQAAARKSDVPFTGTTTAGLISPERKRDEKTINIALVGNPNCGKTSIFNNASNSFEHVGNYGGVTVETKLARIEYQGYTFNIFDLPGTYSLSSYSPEELYVRNFLAESAPDIVINVVDATNLERNLYLTTQLIDMNLRMVIALNMFDELKRKGDHFNHLSFGSLLGIPVVPTVGSKGKGLARLFQSVISKHKEREAERKKIQINYGEDLENSIGKIEKELKEEKLTRNTEGLNTRYAAIKMLEEEDNFHDWPGIANVSRDLKDKISDERSRIRNLLNEEPETLFTDSRYGFIAGALRETYTADKQERRKYSRKVDKVLTHKYLGIPIFFVFLWLMFEATFNLGQYPVDWIDSGIAWLSNTTERLIPEGDFQNLLINGIIGGVGGVIVFLPNILILFFFISFLEDTGYMARAAFIMDKVMHRIGLHGKSFIPLVMGFGCNVPAIMSTRIIESRNNRLLTMLILPFMSCSARLPVYILIIGTFFPKHQGTVLFGIYLTGILLAVLSALLLKKFMLRKEDSSFVMELPPYRIPTLRNTTRHMWHKGSQYLKKIGGIILVASIIIWGLEYYPKGQEPAGQEINTAGFNSGEPGYTMENVQAETGSSVQQSATVKREKGSYLERIGKSLEPVMKPLGFDWKMTVSILSGIAGKELVVSTMGVLYDKHEETGKTLGERIRNDKYEKGEKAGMPVITPVVALSFLMFILVYFPCMAVIATIGREGGSVMWALFTIVYTTGLAWLLSFLVYNAGKLIAGG